ncbi:MAG: hypothetical protein QM779_15265 [Propionicimonas sp.]|uniref:hypothetical protein n=1 Tax=Propionicimonas sp. TaxID=1955623 RepID=UPI003D1266AF
MHSAVRLHLDHPDALYRAVADCTVAVHLGPLAHRLRATDTDAELEPRTECSYRCSRRLPRRQ